MNKEQSTKYYNLLKSQRLEDLTLADHAEIWWYEQGNDIPEQAIWEGEEVFPNPDWDIMYSKWIAFAFNKQEDDKNG